MSGIELNVTFLDRESASAERVAVRDCVVAGWTGSDPHAVEEHIVELEKLGVKRPAAVPIFYRVAASRLTTKGTIEVIGDKSSGEVEFVLFQNAGRLWIGAGSDHTDREAEAVGVTLSKQMCDKPIASAFWAFDDVAPHWNELVLRSHIVEDGARILYQEGVVTGMRPPSELIKLYTGKDSLDDGTMMFCGTFAAQGGVRSANVFEFELVDPRLKRTIRQRYAVKELPVLG